MKKPEPLEAIQLEKFVHGGQCLATAPDGRKLFVWGGLPGETVDVQTTKTKKGYLEGVVTRVITPSVDRVAPLEPDSYISTSPWQIVSESGEHAAKQAILAETFERAGVSGLSWDTFEGSNSRYGYRNKLELSFWGDESGLHFAQYHRGTHAKQVITSNGLALPVLNAAAADLLAVLKQFTQDNDIRAGELKTLLLRCSQAGEVVAALFIKNEAIDFSSLKLPPSVKGLTIWYSNPKSPASVKTKELYTFGDIKLVDKIADKNIIYDAHSFFQVNLPVFHAALADIKAHLKSDYPVVDLYSGVGAIGLALNAKTLIEIDETNSEYARRNASDTKTEVLQLASEAALGSITGAEALIVDPPRVGLHQNLTTHLAEVRPPQIVYLSCNPATQARDVALLQPYYKVSYAKGYNFFPCTPHIESLLVLDKK